MSYAIFSPKCPGAIFIIHHQQTYASSISYNNVPQMNAIQWHISWLIKAEWHIKASVS